MNGHTPSCADQDYWDKSALQNVTDNLKSEGGVVRPQRPPTPPHPVCACILSQLIHTSMAISFQWCMLAPYQFPLIILN